MTKTEKPKNAKVDDVWESNFRRSQVQRIEKRASGNRVFYKNIKANGKLGAEMSALEYVFVRRTLVERDGQPVGG